MNDKERKELNDYITSRGYEYHGHDERRGVVEAVKYKDGKPDRVMHILVGRR